MACCGAATALAGEEGNERGNSQQEEGGNECCGGVAQEVGNHAAALGLFGTEKVGVSEIARDRRKRVDEGRYERPEDAVRIIGFFTINQQCPKGNCGDGEGDGERAVPKPVEECTNLVRLMLADMEKMQDETHTESEVHAQCQGL
jgi:hypothetical protein